MGLGRLNWIETSRAARYRRGLPGYVETFAAKLRDSVLRHFGTIQDIRVRMQGRTTSCVVVSDRAKQ